MYKLGVTVNELKSRFSGVEHQIIFIKSYPYLEAIELENFLHQKLIKYRYRGQKKLLKAGSRELYKMNIQKNIKHILGLQESDFLSKAT